MCKDHEASSSPVFAALARARLISPAFTGVSLLPSQIEGYSGSGRLKLTHYQEAACLGAASPSVHPEEGPRARPHRGGRRRSANHRDWRTNERDREAAYRSYRQAELSAKSARASRLPMNHYPSPGPTSAMRLSISSRVSRSRAISEAPIQPFT